jgi:hypothetical protein
MLALSTVGVGDRAQTTAGPDCGGQAGGHGYTEAQESRHCVRNVVVKSTMGSTTTDFPVSPLTSNPASVLNPQTGTNDLTGNNSGLDRRA